MTILGHSIQELFLYFLFYSFLGLAHGDVLLFSP